MDAFVNLVTQLAANQKSGSVARVCGICSSNDHHTNIHLLKLESGRQARCSCKLGDSASYESKPTSVPRVCGIRSSNDHHTSFSARKDVIFIRGVHDVATDTSTETRKLVGKLDALVNLVTQQATNQNPASDARVCGIRSSNDNHIRVCPSLQQSGVDEHPWLMLQTPIAVRPPQQVETRGVHDVASDTSAKTRKLEGKVDTFENLVTQLAANQKPASVARVSGIHSSNDHHTCFSARNDAIGIRGVHDVATDISAETRKLEGVHDVAIDISAETRKMEGKLDALVNLVTRLVRIISLLSLQESAASVLPMTTILVSVLLHSNLECMSILRLMLQTPIADHHSSREKALDRVDGSQLLGVQLDEHPEAYAANTYSRPPQAAETRYIAKTRKLEGKLDAIVNLVTQLTANQKPASVARICAVYSSNDHHTSVCPSSQQSGDAHPLQIAAKKDGH
ncbi:hypothetical protein Fmac_015284 [Flemingia macrophylla]|uniref:t-SNARE coiled-coil homology domain-containing protein n=1 Tax=Flemingia macrophylla TaxID=520843 RepID=A0ABD1ME59_9FABA